ncbi:hypothetical protein EDD15DRAFT_2190701 [Pisolithus albus]|nr:hypothetical protein EDD15DRAFT_2190701 [Pisolithus albus]
MAYISQTRPNRRLPSLHPRVALDSDCPQSSHTKLYHMARQGCLKVLKGQKQLGSGSKGPRSGHKGARRHSTSPEGTAGLSAGESRVNRGSGIEGETGLEPWQASGGDLRVELDSKGKGGLDKGEQTFQRLSQASGFDLGLVRRCSQTRKALLGSLGVDPRQSEGLGRLRTRRGRGYLCS